MLGTSVLKNTVFSCISFKWACILQRISFHVKSLMLCWLRNAWASPGGCNCWHVRSHPLRLFPDWLQGPDVPLCVQTGGTELHFILISWSGMPLAEIKSVLQGRGLTPASSQTPSNSFLPLEAALRWVCCHVPVQDFWVLKETQGSKKPKNVW